MTKKYNPKSWVDPRIELSSSSIEGKGIFTREPIKKDEVVIIFGGTMFTESDVKSGKVEWHSVAEIGEGLYLGEPRGNSKTIDDFINHSCDSNL